MKTEIWKDVKDYEGVYQVSNLGRVKSLKRKYRLNDKIMKGGKSTSDYIKVTLCKDSNQKLKKVHQLVAIAFLGHIPCGNNLVVDHINTIKTDNHLDNLQIITHRENCSKDKKGSSKYTGVSWYKRCNKWQAIININGQNKPLGYFKTELEASEAYQSKLKTIK